MTKQLIQVIESNNCLKCIATLTDLTVKIDSLNLIIEEMKKDIKHD